MGGSGCGKSSLLETIHGRRQLRKHGFITFAEHEPLTNLLTDYVGYVPQADIMHNDLTVFETVYYSARTRRLDDSKEVIINDVCFVLEKLGLKIMHNSMTKTLSGGKTNQCDRRLSRGLMGAIGNCIGLKKMIYVGSKSNLINCSTPIIITNSFYCISTSLNLWIFRSQAAITSNFSSFLSLK
jgi:hypothetical protein